jgi:diguanylate cyclase (GGDEF)-like protein
MKEAAMTDSHVVIIKQSQTQDAALIDIAASYPNTRIFNSAVDAVQQLEQAPADVVIIESETDDLGGIEAAEMIRDIETESGHFSYIIVLNVNGETALSAPQTSMSSNEVEAIAFGFTHLPRLLATGMRLSSQISGLKKLNTELTRSNLILQKGQLLDPLTGLGNRRFAEQRLKDSIKQIESRGGAACFLLISVQNHQSVIDQYAQKIGDDLIIEIARKIEHLVRPMDIVTYFEPGIFALVLVQPGIENCTADCYQRIYDGVRLKSYKTAAGFLEADIAMSICASHADNGPPNPDTMIMWATQNIDVAFQKKAIEVHYLTPLET